MVDRTESVVLKDIRKSFGDNNVLRGISLSAGTGDVISVLGSSGSGKSTLLRCINLLEIPDSGTLIVSGEEVQMKQTRQGQNRPGGPETG